MTIHSIHDFELALVEPCIAMLERGVRVDDTKRLAMIDALAGVVAPRSDSLRQLVLPLLHDGVPNAHLFRVSHAKKQMVEILGGGDRVKRARKAVLKRYLRRRGLGWDYNPRSDKQTVVVLYHLLKLPKRLRGGKLRVDEDALKDLRAHDRSGFIDHMLHINKAATVTDILKRMAPGDDGRLRTWLNPAGTETGRMSSAETFLEVSTNLQNLPKKVAAINPLYDVRDCIVPDEGKAFVEADLSQAEARVVAALCHDGVLLGNWQDPAFDVHAWTAACIFHKPEAELTWGERYLGKRARHALNYGMQWKTFMAQINADVDQTGVALTAPQAKKIVEEYHALHPSLRRWWSRIEDRLKADGKMTTVFGRRRTFFQRPGEERLKEAIAYEPQSTVADLLNRGLLRWWKSYDGRVGELLLQVHDSILVQAPAQRVRLAADLLRRSMLEEITVNKIALTLPVDIATSTESWARMENA